MYKLWSFFPANGDGLENMFSEEDSEEREVADDEEDIAE